MPRPNRVSPFGTFDAVAARGTLTGNRGVLHDRDGQLGKARWRHRRWIVCRLDWQGIRRPIMAPGRWTELFFLDEAVAFAAGHRPCAYCRRDDYRRFVAAWHAAGLPLPASGPVADSIDRTLHAARIDPSSGEQRRHRGDATALPTGCMISAPSGEALLVVGSACRVWSHAGYGPLRPLPAGRVDVLTPEPLVRVLAAGYRPALHPTASGD
ncbi:MAG: hypothetical protein U1E14_16295 [Geminicoccaceae bacterium]